MMTSLPGRSSAGALSWVWFDKQGDGPALILIDGALSTRSSGSKPELVTHLAPHFAVYSYDRRGRADSGDTLPYALEREIEDIAALIEDAGAAVYLYGHSSGAALGLEAALQLGDRVKGLAMYEAPYNDAPEARLAWRQYIQQLTQALAANRRGDAVALFMRVVGTPADQVEAMRSAPMWPMFEAISPTLAYDHAVILGDESLVPIERAARLTIPAVVMNGGASYPFMHTTAEVLSRAIPQAQLRVLKGQTHNVDPVALAPVLVEKFSPKR
jgi:pimeloyl-ACP methyl ester carboxylesterase